MKKNSILQESKEIKAFFEKNKKLPNFCTIENTELSSYSTIYLITRLLSNISAKSVNTVAIKNPSHLVAWKVDNLKVMKDDYSDMILRFNKYCAANKRVPAYVATKQTGTKVGWELFAYCICKIGAFYKENGYLPNWCVFDNTSNFNAAKGSGSSTKESSHSTSSSCSNKEYTQSQYKQETNWWCWCNAFQLSYYKLTGIWVNESYIAKLCGTTTSGTSTSAGATGLAYLNKKNGTKIKMVLKTFKSLGSTQEERFRALCKIISSSDKDAFLHLNYKNKYGHYQPIKRVDTKNKTVILYNSLSGGYLQTVTYSTLQSWMDSMSQPCVVLFEKK